MIGATEGILMTGAEIMRFDSAAGHKTQKDKTTWLLTDRTQRSQFMNQVINGIRPKCPLAIEIVGYVITVARKQVCSFTNKRFAKASEVTEQALAAPLQAKNMLRIVAAKLIPTAIYGMQWAAPAIAAANALRAKVIVCTWGRSSKMPCPKIVVGVLHDPTRSDYLYAATFREFIDARRMLMKSRDMVDRLIEDLGLHSDDTLGAGPMHGLVSHADVLGIKFHVDGHRLMISTPLGVAIDFCTTHTTYFKRCIRDACRYAILKQLSERIASEKGSFDTGEHGIPSESKKKKKKRPRKDMVGVTPLVDHDATMAMLRSKAKGGKGVEGTDLVNGPGKLCEPCGLSPHSYRRLQTIIAGSIRPPHRSKHILKQD